MSPTYIPEGYRTANPHLIVDGGRRMIEFLVAVFAAEPMHCETADDGSVINAAVRIGDSVIEISDARDEWPPLTSGIHLFVPDCDDAYQRAMDAGATPLYSPADMPYGERSGGVIDPFGEQLVHRDAPDRPLRGLRRPEVRCGLSRVSCAIG